MKKALMLASVASMIDQFSMPNIKLLQEIGYEVHVICNFQEGNTCDESRIIKLQETLHRMRVSWYQWDCPREIIPVKKCVWAYRQLCDVLEKNNYSFIHCNSPVGGALARIAAHRKGIRVIYTAHGFHFYKGAPWKNWALYYPVEKLLARWTDVMITINQEDQEIAERKMHAKKICRIPGIGIDVAKFRDYQPRMTRQEFCRQYGLPEDAKIVLSVGELNTGKNHRMVISVLPQLENSVCYIICGQGKQKEPLLRLAEENGVGQRVRFAGFLEELREVYKHADVFAFPSQREGLSVALMEAMASGLPCVVSDIRGNRELIECQGAKGGGYRFSLGKPGQLHEALEKLLNNEALREACGVSNCRHIEGYGIGIVQSCMEGIYLEM